MIIKIYIYILFSYTEKKKQQLMISKFYSNTTQNLACFTLAKFTGAIITIIIIAGFKYLISGSLHIDYNSHILKQFKTMDLATAIQQKDGYLMFINVIDSKIAYAQNALAKVPTIPTIQYEFNLKNTILRDLEKLNRDKVRSEAKATLLNSRIQFIEAKTNNKN